MIWCYQEGNNLVVSRFYCYERAPKAEDCVAVIKQKPRPSVTHCHQYADSYQWHVEWWLMSLLLKAAKVTQDQLAKVVKIWLMQFCLVSARVMLLSANKSRFMICWNCTSSIDAPQADSGACVMHKHGAHVADIIVNNRLASARIVSQ